MSRDCCHSKAVVIKARKTVAISVGVNFKDGNHSISWESVSMDRSTPEASEVLNRENVRTCDVEMTNNKATAMIVFLTSIFLTSFVYFLFSYEKSFYTKELF